MTPQQELKCLIYDLNEFIAGLGLYIITIKEGDAHVTYLKYDKERAHKFVGSYETYTRAYCCGVTSLIRYREKQVINHKPNQTTLINSLFDCIEPVDEVAKFNTNTQRIKTLLNKIKKLNKNLFC